MNQPFYVHAERGADASVRVAASTDVPGLATEADTVEALSEKLETLVPELLSANGVSVPGIMPFELLGRFDPSASDRLMGFRHEGGGDVPFSLREKMARSAG
jgi:hypothetical protein